MNPINTANAMNLGLTANDAHLLLTRGPNVLKWFAADGTLKHTWEAHNVTVGVSNDPWGHDMPIPPADGYTLGEPQFCGPPQVAYGWWFIPVNDNKFGSFYKEGRLGIGIHGGGTGSPDPFDAWQGAWIPTEGCIRMRNEDLGMQMPIAGTLVYSVQYILHHGGKVYLGVYDG